MTPARPLLLLVLLAAGLAHPAAAGEIHDAVQAGDVPRVKALAAADAALLLTLDDAKRTPLHWAVMSESEPALWELVYTPQALEMRDFMGATPLHLAVINFKTTAPLAGLLARGAPVDVTTRLDKETPLHWAAEQGNLRAAELLLDRGADLRARQLAGATPLHFAAGRSGDPKLVRLLLDRGAELEAENAMRMTPLFNAAATGRTEAVRVLLAAGADPRRRDAAGRTPRSLAEKSKSAETAALLPPG